MIVFRTRNKEFTGATAVEVVSKLEAEADGYPHRGSGLRPFLEWALAAVCDRVSPRDLSLSERMDDEELALSFIYLCDEYGIAKVTAAPAENNGGPQTVFAARRF